MTEPQQELVYRRIGLLSLLVLAGWTILALAVAVTAILLVGRMSAEKRDLHARLDRLSQQVDAMVARPGATGQPIAATNPPASPLASPPVATQPQPVAVASPSTPPSPVTSPTPAPVASPAPTPTSPPASQPAVASATQPDGEPNPGVIDGMFGPKPDRPAGIAGWFFDLSTSAAPDDDNPMLFIIHGPRTVSAALAALVKVEPADATKAHISAERQTDAAQLFLQARDPAQAHRWAVAVIGTTPKLGRAWLVAGLASLGNKETVARAIDELATAAALLPDRPEPLKGLAEAQVAAGQLPKAVDTYRKAVALVPKDTGVAIRLADLLLADRQTDAAMVQLRDVLKADPKQSAVRAHLARLLLAGGKPQDALDLLDDTPDNAPADHRLSLARAEALVAMNKPADAETVLEKALDAVPLSADGWYLLGRVRLKLGNKSDAAVAALERSIAINAESPVAWEYLGLALAASGRQDDAIAKLQEAVRLKVGTARAHYTLAVLYLWKRQTDASLAALKQAVQIDPAYLDTARKEPAFAGLPADSPIGRFLKEGK